MPANYDTDGIYGARNPFSNNPRGTFGGRFDMPGSRVRVRTVPNATIRDPSGQLPPAYTGRESGPQRTQVPVVGRDQTIPILYGGPERMAGLIYFVGYATSGAYAGYLIIIQILCEGPIEEITDIQVNDVAYDTAKYVVSSQLGSQVTVDPVLAAAIPSWTETLNGFAFVVVACRPNVSEGFPRVTAKVKGRKCYDPSLDSTAGGTGSCRLNDSSTWIWTKNPALCLADFLYVYCGRSVNAAKLITASNNCAVTLVYGSPTVAETAAEMTLLLMDQRPVAEWIDVMRGYMPGWVQDHGDEVHIIVDVAGHSVDHTFDSSNIRQDPQPKLFIRGVREVPDVVEVGYTDTTAEPWATRYVSTGSGDTKARIELPGIRSRSRAERFAISRYNHYHLEPIECEFGVFDYGVRVMPGDLATVTESAWGWTAQTVRVLEVKDEGNGRWNVRARVYDANAYSTIVQTNPTYSWTSLPNPANVGVPVGIGSPNVLEVEQYVTNSYANTVRVRWMPPANYPYVLHYIVEFRAPGSPTTVPLFTYIVRPSGNTYEELITPQEIPVGSYAVECRVVSTFGLIGQPLSGSVGVIWVAGPPQSSDTGGAGTLTPSPIWIGVNPPPSFGNGTEWWDSSSGKKYIYYVETGSPGNGQWVQQS